MAVERNGQMQTIQQKKSRNSSIELLRLVCIFGIIFMHTIAYGGNELSKLNRILLIFTNCFTNLGVTCFMLISGYYGVRFQLDKLIKLDLMIIFYTMLHQGIKVVLGVPVGKMDLLSMVFPILSNQYWYLTAYFIIAILSGYLNTAAEKLGRERLQKMLCVLLFLFSVVPTFLHFDILGSEGKNVVHMTMIYLLGRYIRLYEHHTYRIKRLLLLLISNILLTFVLEMGLFLLTGYYSWFYRDCSVFTIVSAVLLFLIFQTIWFENAIINRVASAVLAVYVFSFGFQRLVYLFLPLEEYAFSPLLFPLICVFAPCVVCGCILVDLLRQKIFGKLEKQWSVIFAKWLRQLVCVANTILVDGIGKINHFVEK